MLPDLSGLECDISSFYSVISPKIDILSLEMLEDVLITKKLYFEDGRLNQGRYSF